MTVNEIARMFNRTDTRNIFRKFIAPLLSKETDSKILKELTDAEYRIACGIATRLGVATNKLNQLQLVFMLPVTEASDGITFSAGGGVTICPDVVTLSGVSGFQLPTATENATLCRQTKDKDGNVIYTPISTGQNFQIDAGQNEIFTADAGTLLMRKTETEFPVGIIANYYSSSSLNWIYSL